MTTELASCHHSISPDQTLIALSITASGDTIASASQMLRFIFNDTIILL